MKKVLSFILAMALVISLVPTVAFAAGETVTFYFGDVDAWTSSSTTTVGKINAPKGIEYIFEEGTQKKSGQTSLKAAGKDNLVQIHLKTGTWMTNEAADLQQVVFTAYLGENPAAGWYQISFTGANVTHASDLYIYTNGTYVGEYVSQKTSSSFAVGSPATFGAVYLKPDNEGKVKFIVAPSELADKETNGYVLLHSLSLTYLGDEEDYGYKIAHTIPETIELTADATGVEFTAYADAGDGIPRAMNGWTSNRSSEGADSFSIEAEGNSVEFTSTVTDGIASGKLVPVKAGETTIKFTATINKQTYTDTITVTVPSENADADAEDIDDKISYIVRADERTNDSNVKVSDEKYTVNGTNVGEWTVGKEFTATAKSDGFAYWANGSGTPVSESPIYTFVPTSNFTLEAVYAPATTDTKKVQFWNYNKVYLGDKNVTEDNKVESMPTTPSLNGWSFTNWKTDADTTFDETTVITDVITRVVAQFTKNAAGFNVGGETKAYDDPFSKTADDIDGTNAFSYWTIDGQVASYNKELSFKAWDSVDVVAVYEGAKTAVPTVVLDKVDHTDSPDEYFILYEVPAGYTAVDAGIVFGTAGTTPRVDSTDGSKASVKKAGAKGQFTAAPHKDAAANTVARGYVMYRDSYNNLRVLYTEVK